MIPRIRTLLLFGVTALLALVALEACDRGSSEPNADASSALLSVSPSGGAIGVDPAASVSIRFSKPMMEGMEDYADLHEGDADGPLVPGSWKWGPGMMQMTFTPKNRLKNHTRYFIHLGGGMEDHEGRLLDLERHGPMMGGEWFMAGMHQEGLHGYRMGQGSMGGMGGMGEGAEMGAGWMHPSNGTYGMLFAFTTG